MEDTLTGAQEAGTSIFPFFALYAPHSSLWLDCFFEDRIIRDSSHYQLFGWHERLKATSEYSTDYCTVVCSVRQLLCSSIIRDASLTAHVVHPSRCRAESLATIPLCLRSIDHLLLHCIDITCSSRLSHLMPDACHDPVGI